MVYHFPRKWHFAAVVVIYFICMLLIALWHGTTWGFLAFGVAHGTMLTLVQVHKQFIYPRFGAGLRAFYDRSWAVTCAAVAFNYLFV